MDVRAAASLAQLAHFEVCRTLNYLGHTPAVAGGWCLRGLLPPTAQ